MIRTTWTATAIIAAMILVGCAKHSTVIVMPGYDPVLAADANIDANVAVVLLDKTPEFIYRGDVMKSLRDVNRNNDTVPAELIKSHFKRRLTEDIEREVDVTGVFFGTPNHRYLVTKEVVKTTDEDFTVEIPDERTRFGFDSTDAALVLLLDHVRAGTETDPYYADRAQHGFYTTAARKLIFSASFVLWNNRELKPICYGRIMSLEPISREEATLANWENVSRKFVRQMFAETGFLRRKDKDAGN